MGLDHGIRHATGSEENPGMDICRWRKNYVIRQWLHDHAPGFEDNGVTPLTKPLIGRAIQALADYLNGDTWPVTTPATWYARLGIDTDPGEQATLQEQASQALADLAVILHTTEDDIEYWEWY